MSWDSIMALVELIEKTFGVAPTDFLTVSLAAGTVLAVIRAFLKDFEFTQAKWYKPVLSAASLLLGVGAAFLAWSTVLYAQVPNAATIAFLGVFNGFVAMGVWQFVKYLPKVSELVTGKLRVSLDDVLGAASKATENATAEDAPPDDATEVIVEDEGATDNGNENAPKADDKDA